MGRIAVLLESGRRGAVALERAAELAREREDELTVIAVAPQAPRSRCGGFSPDAYNAAVREEVIAELARAADELHALGVTGRFELLVQGRAPTLEQFLNEQAISLILLPPGRSLPGAATGHRGARRLRRLTGH